MGKFSFHCQHYKAGQINGIDRHNRRLNKNYISNPDINTEYSLNNRIYISPNKSLYQDCKAKIQKEVIENGGRVTKISNWITECIFTYPEDLLPDRMDEYNRIILGYMGNCLGKDNIVEAVAHLDEGGLPHLHVDIVPITEDKKLSSKKLITRDFILSVHNNLPKVLREHGFLVERGEETKERGKAGRSARQYKKDMDKEAREIDNKINVMITEYNNLVERYNMLREDYKQLEYRNYQKAQIIVSKPTR